MELKDYHTGRESGRGKAWAVEERMARSGANLKSGNRMNSAGAIPCQERNQDHQDSGGMGRSFLTQQLLLYSSVVGHK